MIAKIKKSVGAKSFFFIWILQLITIAGFIFHFNIEESFNLPQVFPFVVIAAFVSALVPIRFRKLIGVLATIVGLTLIMPIFEAVVLLFIAMALVGICNLPTSVLIKKCILVLVVTIFALIKTHYIPVSWITTPVLTILASMFMFRMILFLYEMKYEDQRASFLDQLSYFLLLPNIIFPLFPVVDYKLFQSNYYNIDAQRIYQRGVFLIAKATLYLFAYRIIYSFLLPSQFDLNSVQDFFEYIVFTYLLSIRLAGIFHFSVGVLCLFGYDLPDVFRNHFAATGFGDLWRRINIYWKDFVIKVYFNHFYFKLKRFGRKRALFWSTMLAFLVTLILHEYQFFWLTGVFEISIMDVIFWGFFGIVVSLETLKSQKHKPAANENIFNALKYGALVVTTFLTMSFLWSIWSSSSVEDWFALFKAFEAASFQDFVSVGALILLSIVLVSGLGWGIKWMKANVRENKIELVKFSPLVVLVLLAFSFNGFTIQKFWEGRLSGNSLKSIFYFNINTDEREHELAGYYDNMLDNNDLLSSVAHGADDRVKSELFRQQIHSKGILIETNDARYKKLKPSTEAMIEEVQFKVNSLGMRDEEVSDRAEHNRLRIAMAGASIETGWLIHKELTFESLLEEKFMTDVAVNEYNIEVLNFSVPGRVFLNTASAIEQEVFPSQPDILIMFHHPDLEWMHIKNRLSQYNFSENFDGTIGQLYQKYDLLNATPNERNEWLNPHEEAVMKQLYKYVLDLCQTEDIKLVLVNMPRFLADFDSEIDKSVYWAEAEGIEIIDIAKPYDLDMNPYLLDYGGHPNIEGNKLIFDRLYPSLIQVIQKYKKEH